VIYSMTTSMLANAARSIHFHYSLNRDRGYVDEPRALQGSVQLDAAALAPLRATRL
jgi:hypothetical protein